MPLTSCVTTRKPLLNEDVDTFLVGGEVVTVYPYSFILYPYSFLTPILFLSSS